MQRIPKAIPASQIGTSASILYTAPGGTTATINNLSVTNTSANVVKVSLFRVPSAASPGATNCLMSNRSFSPGESYVPPASIGLQLDPGMSLQASADTAAAITIMGGVYETSGS